MKISTTLVFVFLSLSTFAQKKWADYGLKIFDVTQDSLTLYGLKKPDGTIILPPKYKLIKDELKGGYAIMANVRGEKMTNEKIIQQGKDGSLVILTGLIDSTGKVVVEPFATSIFLPFKDNITLVYLNERFNILTKQGKLLSEEYSPTSYNLDEKYFIVYSKNGLKSGLVDSKGMYVLPFEYNNIQYKHLLQGDFVRLSKDKKYGIYSLDEKKFVVPIAFDLLAIPEDYNYPFLKVTNAGKNGVYDISKNKLIVPCSFTEELRPEFYTSKNNIRNLVYFVTKDEENEKYGIISTSGIVLLSANNMEILPLSFLEDRMVGYIKQYDPRSNKVLYAYYLFNYTTNEFHKSKFVYSGVEASAVKSVNLLVADTANHKWGLIDCQKDKYLLEPQFDRIWTRLNLFLACKDGKYAVYSFDGEAIVPMNYYDITNLVTGKTVSDYTLNVCKDKKWGCIDITGKILVPLVYDKEVKYGVNMWVSQNDKWGMINKYSKVPIIAFKYDTAIYSNFRKDTIDTHAAYDCQVFGETIKLNDKGDVLFFYDENINRYYYYVWRGQYFLLAQKLTPQERSVHLGTIITYGDIEMFRFAIERFPEIINMPGFLGHTHIYSVASKLAEGVDEKQKAGCYEMLKTLSSAGVDPNKPFGGYTPLGYYIKNQNSDQNLMDNLKHLLDAGCMVSYKDEFGKDALYYAKKKELPEVAMNLLNEYKKKEK